MPSTSSIDPTARFRDSKLVRELAASISSRSPGRFLRFMHVCGTHESFISQYGIRTLLPSWLEVVAGPGCPVCICPAAEIDMAVRLVLEHHVILATFGDVLRVPARLSLADAKAQGGDVRLVYSIEDAVDIARRRPRQQVVFFAVGFETTACTVASSISRRPPDNFTILSAHRLIPPALEALLAAGGPVLSGYVLPGHVMTVMGTTQYEPLPERFDVALAVAGFEPVDILLAIDNLVAQVVESRPTIFNGYRRAVRREGNSVARGVMQAVFEPIDASWRGIGVIPASGLRLRTRFRNYDARLRFGVTPDPSIPDIQPGCSCDMVMLGRADPAECQLFGGACTPEHPAGPCMVSIEGTCNARYRYREPASFPSKEPASPGTTAPDRRGDE